VQSLTHSLCFYLNKITIITVTNSVKISKSTININIRIWHLLVCSNPSPAATRAAALGIRDKLTTGGNAAAAAAAATEVVSTFTSEVAVVGTLSSEARLSLLLLLVLLLLLILLPVLMMIVTSSRLYCCQKLRLRPGDCSYYVSHNHR